MDEKERRRVEKTRRYEEQCVRWRWGATILYSINLSFAIMGIWEKRSQWPGLLRLDALTQFRDFSSVEWKVFCLMVWSLLLAQTWVIVGRHRREQARQELERLTRVEASVEGVWPPKPTPPVA